jgi:prepilin-type N-terminal cleavage/methylation domain-containing protein
MFFKKQSGFSLVELSVTLAVIGVTLGGALTLATKKTEADKLAETETKMQAIADRLDAYLINASARFPCPADGSLAVTNASFGVEGAPSASSATVGCSGSNFNSNGVYAGVVPTKTIWLADDMMLDGWGRRIDYIVDFNFANNSTTNTAPCDGSTVALHKICFKYTANGSITVNDSTGAARTTTAVYVLISHGKNGRGAWIATGSATRLAASTDAGEMSNAGNDAGSFDTTFVQKDTDATFDDIVTYRNKAQILDNANAVTDSDLCTAAAAYATNCVGATSVTVCNSLSTTIGNWCLDM